MKALVKNKKHVCVACWGYMHGGICGFEGPSTPFLVCFKCYPKNDKDGNPRKNPDYDVAFNHFSSGKKGNPFCQEAAAAPSVAVAWPDPRPATRMSTRSSIKNIPNETAMVVMDSDDSDYGKKVAATPRAKRRKRRAAAKGKGGKRAQKSTSKPRKKLSSTARAQMDASLAIYEACKPDLYLDLTPAAVVDGPEDEQSIESVPEEIKANRVRPGNTGATNRARYTKKTKMECVIEAERLQMKDRDAAAYFKVPYNTFRQWKKQRIVKEEKAKCTGVRMQAKAASNRPLKRIEDAVFNFFNVNLQLRPKDRLPVTGLTLSKRAMDCKEKLLEEDSKSAFLTDVERYAIQRFTGSDYKEGMKRL